MHESVSQFARSAIKPLYVKGKDVLEAGAMDVNGSIRPMVELMGPQSYLATDIRPGPGVDEVCAAENLRPKSADLVICMEMLEHAYDWRAASLGLSIAVRDGGWLLVTTRSPGFPYHGYPEDYHRFTVDDMRALLKTLGMDIIRCEPDTDTNQPGVCAVGKKVRRPDVEALARLEVHAAPPYPSGSELAWRVRHSS